MKRLLPLAGRPAWLRRWPLGPYAAPYLLLLTLLVALLPRTGFQADVSLWAHWAQYIRARGLGHIYTLHGVNYNPLYLYFLWLYGALAGDAPTIADRLPFLKLLTLPFDVAGALAAASLVRRPEQRFAASLLLLNVAYLFNTLFWGQVDGIYSSLVFGAFLTAVRGRTGWSVLLFVLGLNAKLQAIVFLPGLLLLWVPEWVARPRRLLAAAAVGLLAQGLILLPFILAGGWNYVSRIILINRQARGYYPYVSMNAYNFWSLPLDGDNTSVVDTLQWHGLTYHQWGMLLFLACSAVVLLPLFINTLRRLRKGANPLSLSPLLLIFGLIPLEFCFFNTQMHDRYWHSSLLFLAGYGFLTGRYLSFALVSIAYFITLRIVLFPSAAFTHAHEKILALMFAAALLLGLRDLYRTAGPQQRPAADL